MYVAEVEAGRAQKFSPSVIAGNLGKVRQLGGAETPIPPAIVLSLTNPPPGAAAYTDSEISGGRPGSFYYNITDASLHICNVAGYPPCTWQALTSSTSILPLNNAFIGNNTFAGTTGLNGGGNIAGTYTGAPTLSGAWTFTGLDTAVCFSSLNSTAYVGGPCAGAWGGGDIGAQINAAYLALPVTGGGISIIPAIVTVLLQGSQPYTWITQVLFNVVGKYVVLKGLAPASQSTSAGVNLSQGGVTLNWSGTTGVQSYTVTGVTAPGTPSGIATYAGTFSNGGSNGLAGKTFQVTGFSTAANNGYFVCTASTTSALTLANGLAVTSSAGSSLTATQATIAMIWANDPGAAGDGYAVANSLEDIGLFNAPYSGLPNGGNSYATVGLDFSGAGRLQTKNLRIGGFGVGKQAIGSIGWGATDVNQSLAWNNVGMLLHNDLEGYGWLGGSLAVNGVGIQTSGTTIVGADVALNKVSIDGNTVYGILSFAGLSTEFSFHQCHWENAGGTNAHYLFVQASPTSVDSTDVSIVGGGAFDDVGTGSTDYWFSVGQGSTGLTSITTSGFGIQTAGRSTSSVFQVGGQGGFLQGQNATPAKLTVLGGTSVANVTELYTNMGTVHSFSGFRGGSSLVLTTSLQNVGVFATAGMFVLTDGTIKGTCIVTFDSSTATVIVTGGVGTAGAAFVSTATPTSTQIGLQYNTGTGFLQVIGGSTRSGDVLGFTQIAND